MSIRVMLPLSLALALGACSGPRVTYQSPRDLPIESFYQYGAGGRDLPLVVSGRAFNAPQPAVDAVIETVVSNAQALQPPTRARVHPDASARSNYKLVVALQPPLSQDGYALCSGGGGLDAPGPMVRVDMALCISGRAYSYASGQTEATGPDDPRFAELIQLLTGSVFHRDEPIGSQGGDAVQR